MGTFSVSFFLISAAASLGFMEGGSLQDRRTDVPERTTFPAIWMSGRPPAPVIDRVAYHTLLRYILTMSSSFMHLTPSFILYFLNISSPHLSAMNLASASLRSGTSTLSSSQIYPVSLSSIRSSSVLTTRKVSGIIPPTSPEWYPDAHPSTVKSIIVIPLREEVIQSCS